MNERIENCLYQAGLTAQGCWDELDDYAKEAIEKFAELIVQECVSICAKENWKTLGVDMKGMKQFDRGVISGRKIMSKELCDKIEEHFGVE